MDKIKVGDGICYIIFDFNKLKLWTGINFQILAPLWHERRYIIAMAVKEHRIIASLFTV